MDMGTLYILASLGVCLFITSLGCAVTNRANVITIMCMFFSGIIFWALSNEFIGGTVTRLNEVTGTADIIQDATASNILLVVGLLMIAGFAFQVWQAVHTSGVVSELDN